MNNCLVKRVKMEFRQGKGPWRASESRDGCGGGVVVWLR